MSSYMPSVERIRSIYAGAEQLMPAIHADIQGWNSESPLFEKLIRETKPKVIVEVGVWKGASLIHMAKLCKAAGLLTVLFGVDVWYGQVGDMITEVPLPLPKHWARPTLYQQFILNVKLSGHDDCIIPVWQHAKWGAKCLATWDFKADLIYIDADHDEGPCLDDLRNYWPILNRGGVMFGDDYSPGACGVPQAVQRFSAESGKKFTVAGCQWHFDPK